MDKAESSQSDLREKTIATNRVTKVVKGGRIMSFSVLVVVGDGRGRVGIGKGKAKEAPLATAKALDRARRDLVKVRLNKGSIFHRSQATFGAAKVLLMPAAAGTGVIAGGAMRAVFDAVGITDILAKSIGTSNPHSVVKATMKALSQINSPRDVAARRGKPAQQFMPRAKTENTVEVEGLSAEQGA